MAINFREGVRRTFFATGGLAALIALVTVLSEFPQETDYARWEYALKNSVQQDFDAHPSNKWKILWDDEEKGKALLELKCANPTTPMVKETCRLFRIDDESLIQNQALHIGGAALAASATFFAFYVFWRLLDWILAGFMRPSVTAPRSEPSGPKTHVPPQD